MPRKILYEIHSHKQKPLVAFYRMTAELLQIISVGVGASSASGRSFVMRVASASLPEFMPPSQRARECHVIEVGSTPRAESRNYAQFCKGHFGWRGELPEAEFDESAGSRAGAAIIEMLLLDLFNDSNSEFAEIRKFAVSCYDQATARCRSC